MKLWKVFSSKLILGCQIITIVCITITMLMLYNESVCCDCSSQLKVNLSGLFVFS